MSTRTHLLRFFGEQGLLKQALPGFVVRPQQQAVAAAIEAALSEPGQIALIEAGTGVGKTLAYLLPALRHVRADRRIVVSTHTLALQAQLASKDVPLVQSVWKKPVSAAVVKGRGNYLCLQDQDAARTDLWTAGDPLFARVAAWSRTTATGDVAELDFAFPGWADIRANTDTCKAQECRFFDRCFYYRMRHEAQDAEILLVNHALFFSDLAVRRSGDPDAKLLPDYDFVIFDEAHHLEAAAASAFGVSFSSARLPALIDKIRRFGRHLDLSPERLKAIEGQSQGLFEPFLHSPRPDFFVSDILRGEAPLQSARAQAAGVAVLLDALALEMRKQDTGGNPALKDRLDGLRRHCVRAREELGLVFGADDPNFVRWGTLHQPSRRAPIAALQWTPISVAPLLHAALWRQPRAIGAALLSATLSTDGGFGYLRGRLGIPPDAPHISETVVGSPFDYARNCLLYLPRHLPMPSDNPGYAYDLASEMIALLEASQGGAFLLFTSHRALNAAYDQITQSELPYPLLRQGEMPNARLIETFKAEKNAVLFGTQSFWEGVDVPGADLRLVIIDRIPFAMPDSPLHKARVEEITKNGGDWFGDFALPQAQLRLKQGFGRLIRSASDRGVVAILDTRLVRKAYGERFLRFLPPARRVSDLADVEAFFTGSASQ